MSTGVKTTIGIGFQNSYGTAKVDSMHWLPFLSEGVALGKEQVVSESIRGVFDEGINYEGQNMVEGDIEVEAQSISLGVLLKAAIGDPTSVQSGSFYTHTFKPAASDFDRYALNRPFTILKAMDDSGSAHQFHDMVGTKLSMSIANGELVKTTLSVMGGKYGQIADPGASYPTQSLIGWDVGSVSIGGSAIADLREINIEVDNAGENTWTINASKYPSRTKRNGFRTVSIDGTLVFETQTEYQQFVSQAERQLIITMINSTAVSSGYYEQLRITAPLMRYTEFKPTADGPNTIEVGFTAKGVYSPGSGTAIEFVLVNTQSAY